MTRTDDLDRIRQALHAARDALAPFTSGDIAFETKDRGDPLTAADLAVDAALRASLAGGDEAWLSEESGAAGKRSTARRVWVVDPIDGTREFVDGIPEWCVSIGLVEDGVPVAGGVFNPATDDEIVGAMGVGVTLNGAPVAPSEPVGVRVLASRSEVRRGEWERYADAPFEVVPCGSVAWKLGLVAAGRAEATWTLTPKSEWDVAAGAALVRAAGGSVALADGTDPAFNRDPPVFPSFAAAATPALWTSILPWLEAR